MNNMANGQMGNENNTERKTNVFKHKEKAYN